MDNKKYWLKLNKDFLKSPHIKVIKDMDNGKDYVIFYLALMLESIETVGHLKFSELVPYNEQMLSSLTDTNIDIVRAAVTLFRKLGLIEFLDDGTIYMNQVAQLTGKECDSAERVRLYRSRKNNGLLQCNTTVTKCNDNIDKDKEIDIDKDKEKDKEKRRYCAKPKVLVLDQVEEKRKFLLESFERFFKEYPKKKNRKKSLSVWLRINPSPEGAEAIISAVKNQRNQLDWIKEDGKYIPLPSKWLEEERWDDEVDVPKSAMDVELEELEKEGYRII